MKRILAAGLALAMGTAVANATDFGSDGAGASVLSPQPISGHVELYGQGLWQDYWDYYYRGIGAAGRVNWWFAPNMSAQFDLGGQMSSDVYGNGYGTYSFYGAAHVSKRTESRLLGVFGGVAAPSDYYGQYGGDPSIFGGVEGQWYNGPFTLYSQAGLMRQLAGYYGPPSDPVYAFTYFFGQVEGRYFITPNTKASVNIGIVTGSIWGGYGGSQTVFSYGGELEHRFASNPLSIFGRLQGFTGGPYYVVNGYRAMGGIKFNFGTGTLEEQDRSGATLKVMEDFAPIGDLRAFD
jgi:hypothetical protein